MAIFKRPDFSIRGPAGEFCALISAEDLAALASVLPAEALSTVLVRSENRPKWKTLLEMKPLAASPVERDHVRNYVKG